MPSDTDILWYLRVDRQDTDGVVVVRCAGRVSNRTCPELERALDEATGSPTRAIVLDVSGLDYISSPGLRALERASSRLTARGGALVVCGLTDAVSAAFSFCGLTASLRVEPSRDAAIAAARQAPTGRRLDASHRDV